MQGCTSLNEKKVTRNLTRHKIYARCRLNGRVLCCAPHDPQPIGYYPFIRIQTKETPRPTPPTHQRQARTLGCIKSKKKKNSLKPRMANDIQSSTRYPERGCCSLPQQSIFQTRLTSMSAHQITPTTTSTSRSVACSQDFKRKCVFVQHNGP
jgi:hypothetical protein